MGKYLSEPDIGVIYDELAPRIYRYVYHRLGQQALAEDLTSEVFLRFLRARVAPENPAAYLYRIAHNLIVDHVRHNPQLLSLDESIVYSGGEPQKMAEVEVERLRLRRAILRLTPDQQQVIVLKYLEGLENADIAAVLDKPEGAVKSLQHRALRNLRSLLGSSSQAASRLEFARLLE